MSENSTVSHVSSVLVRLKPEPLPVVHPVPEIDANERLSAVYADTKAVLGVPWMGVVTMAFAHYPRFYDILWQSVRPLCLSQEFTEACRELRSSAEAAAAQLSTSPLEKDLHQQGYSGRELDQIRDLIEVFSEGNMPYLLLATIARLLLEGHNLSTQTAVTTTDQTDSTPPQSLILMEPHHADPQLITTYEDIKATLGLPFVNTDYRALARWPSYFRIAWQDIRLGILSDSYQSLVHQVHNKAVELALNLPNPGALTPQALQQAATDDASVQEILGVVRLFQYLLPGLATNVAMFRSQLRAR